MNVGQAVQRSGLSAKTIRFYEDIGLVALQDAPNGYRDCTTDDVQMSICPRSAPGARDLAGGG